MFFLSFVKKFRDDLHIMSIFACCEVFLFYYQGACKKA